MAKIRIVLDVDVLGQVDQDIDTAIADMETALMAEAMEWGVVSMCQARPLLTVENGEEI